MLRNCWSGTKAYRLEIKCVQVVGYRLHQLFNLIIIISYI